MSEENNPAENRAETDTPEKERGAAHIDSITIVPDGHKIKERKLSAAVNPDEVAANSSDAVMGDDSLALKVKGQPGDNRPSKLAEPTLELASGSEEPLPPDVVVTRADGDAGDIAAKTLHKRGASLTQQLEGTCSLLSAAPEIFPIEEPAPPLQSHYVGVGGLGRTELTAALEKDDSMPQGRCQHQHPEGRETPSPANDTSAGQEDPASTHREGHSPIDFTYPTALSGRPVTSRVSLPGAHRMYTAGMDQADKDSSETVSSASSRGSSPNIVSGTSVVTSDLHGDPIVGFVPYGANQDDLVDRVRDYLRENAPVADVVSSGKVKKDVHGSWWGRHRRVVALLLVAVAVVAIVTPTAIVLFASSKSSDDESNTETPTYAGAVTSTTFPSFVPTHAPSASPSECPSDSPSISSEPSLSPTVSSAPTSEHRVTLKNIVTSAYSTQESVSAFLDSSSPQSQALRWLSVEDYVTIDGDHSLLARNSTGRILTRYALAVLYFSTGGGEWRNRYNWLSGHECLWYAPYECVSDYPIGWVDFDGRDCTIYAQGSNCEDFGWATAYEQNGYVANEACCVCKRKWFNYDMGVYCERVDNEDLVIGIYLEDNNLTGTLPNDEIGQLKSLREIRMQMNKVGGEMPSTIGELTHLEHLDLYKNRLRGSLPSSLESLGKLSLLRLRENVLSGTIIHGIGSMSSLWYLDADTNRLNGTIPPSIGQLSNLTYLTLGFNKLSGRVPPSIGNMTNLEYLYLFSNHLTGEIPSTINELHKLSLLYLASNFLTGPLPLFEEGGLQSLEQVHIGDNMLSGSIPKQIGVLSNLEVLVASNNILKGTFPSGMAVY